MAKKTLKGLVTQVNDNQQNKIAVIETAPATPGKDNKPATPAKRFQIATNNREDLAGLEVGKTVTITIE